VEIQFPGAASDLHVFEQLHLMKKLEKKAFVCLGYFLVDIVYMCTSCRNVGSSPKDSLWFFNSQLSSTTNAVLECWFIDGVF